MSDAEGCGAVLHGLFALQPGVSIEEFRPAFEAFYGHLEQMGFVCGYCLMQRQPLEERFGAGLPEFDYHVAIEFPSLEHDRACYEYVSKDEEPVRSLHRAMNSKVRRGSARFFLGAQL
jgi:hypothetical protein